MYVFRSYSTSPNDDPILIKCGYVWLYLFMIILHFLVGLDDKRTKPKFKTLFNHNKARKCFYAYEIYRINTTITNNLQLNTEKKLYKLIFF